MNDLLFSVGLDVADLKTSAKVVKEQADDIKRGFKGFKDVLEFGGVSTAVFGFFKSVIDYANDLKGPLDENTAAVRRFSEGLTATKEGFLSAGAQFMGFFNRAGEGLGALVRSMIDGKDAVKQAAQSERETAEVLAKIEAEKKKNAAEYQKITTELAAVEKERVKVAAESLTAQEKLNLAQEKLAEAQQRYKEAAGNQLESRRAELAVRHSEVEVAKALGAVAKENAEQEQKSAQEAEKAAAAEAKQREKHNDLIDKKLKLQFDALSNEEKIAKLARDEEALRKTIADFKRMGVDTTEQEVVLMETQAALGKLRTEIAKEQNAEQQRSAQLTADQIAAEQRVTAEIEEQIRRQRALNEVKFATKGRGDEDLSDAALADKLQTLTRSVAERERMLLQGERYGPGVASGTPYDPLLGFERNELARVQAELTARTQIRQRVAQFGETGAARLYQGNIPEFERLLEFVRASPEAKKQTTVLEEMNRRLATVLGLN